MNFSCYVCISIGSLVMTHKQDKAITQGCEKQEVGSLKAISESAYCNQWTLRWDNRKYSKWSTEREKKKWMKRTKPVE